MKRLPRPRTWIALFVGIAAGLVVWMLPPLPKWRAVTPAGSDLHALSQDGKRVLTCQPLLKRRYTVQVWDRAKLEGEPINFADSLVWQAFFSPDGESLAFVDDQLDYVDVKWIELASGDVIDSRRRHPVGDVAMSPQGELLYYRRPKLYRVDDDQEAGQLPEDIDGLTLDRWLLDRFAVYLPAYPTSDEDCKVLVYDAFHSKEVARFSIAYSRLRLQDVSNDGQVIALRQKNSFVVIADSGGATRQIAGARLSPNGDFVVTQRPTERSAWLQKWWPLEKEDTTCDIVDWRTGVTHASLRGVDVKFSPNNEHVAVMQRDGVVSVYAWPVRLPWGVRIVAVLGSAASAWTFGWLWTRWRERRIQQEVPRETPTQAT